MQAKEVHMFSQNCTIISTEEIILLFIHGVLQRLCLLSLCFIASFNFRALLTKQNTKKIRKKDHRRMMRDQQARPVPIVCLWCMHAFGDWELQFVLNPGCHLSQTFSLWVVCVCIFSFFFRYFVYLTVRKLLCGIVYEATRGSTGACLMIFFFLCFFLISYAHFIVSDHHRGVFNNTEKNCSSLFCSRQQTLTREGADHLVGATFIFPFFSCRFQFCRTKQTKYILYIIIHSTYAR